MWDSPRFLPASLLPGILNGAVALLRIAVGLFVLGMSSTAMADPALTTLQEAEKLGELPGVMQVPASVLYHLPAPTPSTTPAKHTKKHSASSSGCNQNGCGYKALLGNLVITKDLVLSPKLSVRVLPTSHALGGEDAKTPILVRAESKGEDYYGVRVHAQF